jgi:hypothetical protein
MGITTVVTDGGMVFLDDAPLPVRSEDVEPRDSATVPSALRDHAHTVLPNEPGDWWTVGEFRDRDGEFTTAVARRIPDGVVRYGTSD